jgi:hypothetical protein
MRGRIVLAVLSSLFWSTETPAQLPQDERTALVTIIAAEARTEIDSPWQHRACVDPELFGAFDDVRAELNELASATVMGARKDEFVARRREELTSGERNWQHYVAVKGGWTDGTRLSPDEEAPLTAAVAALIRQRPATAHARIDPSLPPPLVYGTQLGCPTLRFSEPAIQGNLAFVETSFVCGSLCGLGQLYALRREGDSWRIVAVAGLWIS